MKPKELQELIDFIATTGLAEVNIETESLKLQVKKYPDMLSAPVAPVMHALPNPQVQPVAQVQPQTQQNTAANKENEKSEAKASDTLITIKSPMIGTFYRSASPDKAAFVNVGDSVGEGSPVCIIEAMKLFNEIESEVSGTIVKILVENASPVEYDQPLFLVEPK
jgi:acetyl-CoA carboxylase biotin carboxyl carrier protein